MDRFDYDESQTNRSVNEVQPNPYERFKPPVNPIAILPKVSSKSTTFNSKRNDGMNLLIDCRLVETGFMRGNDILPIAPARAYEFVSEIMNGSRKPSFIVGTEGHQKMSKWHPTN